MDTARSILRTYFGILEDGEIARFLQCKNVPISFDASESTKTLWEKHSAALKKWNVQDVQPKQSLLDLKIELAQRIYQDCCFCERRCGIDRRKTVGDCGVAEAKISSEFLHIGEESVLVPSYTIFFSGCTFHCVFCQNWDISQHYEGLHMGPSSVATLIQRRKQEGARNVNWVGGDPTSNLPYIFHVLNECETNLPQVWNSNMYCSTETMTLLNGIIDVFLTDFKYGNDQCAQRLSKVKKYSTIVRRNHEIAYQQGELIVRHLVLPGHVHCCSEPILHWINRYIPNVLVNVMAQYRPEYQAHEYDDIAMPLSIEEFTQIKNLARYLQIHEV